MRRRILTNPLPDSDDDHESTMTWQHNEQKSSRCKFVGASLVVDPSPDPFSDSGDNHERTTGLELRPPPRGGASSSSSRGRAASSTELRWSHCGGAAGSQIGDISFDHFGFTGIWIKRGSLGESHRQTAALPFEV